MACTCNQTHSLRYWIIYDNGSFIVTEPRPNGKQITSCDGSLYVSLTMHDCAHLTFEYQKSRDEKQPAILPMLTNGDCPCEVVNGSGSPPVTYEARFKPPKGGSCTYWWTLFSEQPTCKIRIIVSQS